MFAVIRIGGRQYIVKEGDIISTQLAAGAAGNVECKDVLLIANAKNVKVGTPVVSGALVEGRIIEQKRSKTIDILKYHSKTRYRKRIGFRPIITKIKIEKISA